GKPNVGFHRGDPYVSARKSPKKNTANTISTGKIAAPSQTGSSPGGEFERAGQAADFIFSQTSVRPRIALVLGSGLGAFADEFASATKIPYAKIPRFPQSTAIGHAGKLVIGKVGIIPVVAMQGRVHLYEGYSSKEVAFPIRVFARMGVQAVILTNAAGGIKREFVQGRLVVISDHINLQGVNPLIGPNDERFGLRFHDMTSAYDRRFREMTVAEGNRLGNQCGGGNTGSATQSSRSAGNRSARERAIHRLAESGHSANCRGHCVEYFGACRETLA